MEGSAQGWEGAGQKNKGIFSSPAHKMQWGGGRVGVDVGHRKSRGPLSERGQIVSAAPDTAARVAYIWGWRRRPRGFIPAAECETHTLGDLFDKSTANYRPRGHKGQTETFWKKTLGDRNQRRLRISQLHMRRCFPSCFPFNFFFPP